MQISEAGSPKQDSPAAMIEGLQEPNHPMRESDFRAAIDKAVACFRSGDLARAEDIYRRIVVNAPIASLYADLGVICNARGKQDEAIAFLRKAVELEPKSVAYRFKLAETYYRHGMRDDASNAWNKVLELEPRHADTLSWLGCLDLEAEQLDQAIERFRQSIAANPEHYYALDNLGTALRKKGEPEQAIQWHRRAIALKPDQPEAYTHLGTALTDLDQLEDAVSCHQKALAVAPSFAAAHCNLANSYLDVFRLNDALASYQRAIELEPGNASYHWNYSNALLLIGDFDRGWMEYEWRWNAPELRKQKPAYPGPEWQGEDIVGKTVLIYAEQGFGDSIQFIRYASTLAERGARVFLVIQPELERLLSTARGVSQVFHAGQPLPRFDVHVPLLSLPRLLKTRLDSIPSRVPYISADRSLVDKWRMRIGEERMFRVGLIWRGRPSHRFDRRRSCALADLAPLARIGAVRFYSLQKGEQAAKAKSLPDGMTLIDWTNELGDFAETAALMANLDLIISVDTAGVHLAGALGKPVWLLNRHQTEWRWLLDREDSPWYPKLRIFRQPRIGDWQSVMERVAGELQNAARPR